MSTSGKLAGKVAIVTGGGGGFGEGIAKKFVSEGAKVLIMDINGDDALKVARNSPSGTVISMKGDVSQESDWRAALREVLDGFGALDIVVNNAGVLHMAQPSTDVSENEYDRIMQINVKQLFWSSKVIIPYFIGDQRPGVFINISSMSAPRPRPNLVWYAASKGAVNSATRGLAAEYAKNKIRFNAILPSVGDTSMTPLFLGHDTSAEAHAKMLDSIPLGRLCLPDDIGNAASFLASTEASYMTGVCLEVDGGRGI